MTKEQVRALKFCMSLLTVDVTSTRPSVEVWDSVVKDHIDMLLDANVDEEIIDHFTVLCDKWKLF